MFAVTNDSLGFLPSAKSPVVNNDLGSLSSINSTQGVFEKLRTSTRVYMLLALAALSVAPKAAIASEAFTPDDPYFTSSLDSGQNGTSGQWYLDKTGSSALVDLNVVGAWARGLTGQGVTIGFVDTGVEWTHPDLIENYDSVNSWDFENGDSL